METIENVFVEKTHKQQLNDIKTNIIKMLVNRGFINKENENKYIEKFINDNNDNLIYTIKLDNDKNYNTTIPKKQIMVTILNYKVISVNKTSQIGNFIFKYFEDYKIILLDSINAKSEQTIDDFNTPYEIFKISQLSENIVDNIYVPKHIVLPEEEGKQVLDAYCAKKKDMPFILTTDPIAKYYNMKNGEVCKIIRNSSITVNTIFYRLVINAGVKNN
jgi:DNA-directed RNA polymerase I, II, and III subunit RPABC1